MRALLLALILTLGFTSTVRAEDIESFKATQRAWEDLNHVTRADLSLFFDRISLTDHGWEFKLSPNVRGMLWRIRKDRSDVTGACDSGQVLDVPRGASLLIKRKDLDLFFKPSNLATFNVRLTTRTEIGGSLKTEEREALLAAHGSGFALMYSED
jgi:hypothetical protein